MEMVCADESSKVSSKKRQAVVAKTLAKRSWQKAQGTNTSHDKVGQQSRQQSRQQSSY